MFRVVPPSIIRSANNCIYSIWYLSNRYCYLPLSWKSWNWFECAVGGVLICTDQYATHSTGFKTSYNIQITFVIVLCVCVWCVCVCVVCVCGVCVCGVCTVCVCVCGVCVVCMCVCVWCVCVCACVLCVCVCLYVYVCVCVCFD